MQFIKGIRLREMPPKSSYIHYLPIVQYLNTVKEIEFNKPITFLVGENGTGKSTLLEAIAVLSGLNPEGDSIHAVFSTNDTHSDLCDYLQTKKFVKPDFAFFLRAESFYNFATYLDKNELSKTEGSFHAMSHGEAFISLMEDLCGSEILYILDEPEAALSPMKLLQLIVLINEAVERGSQFIISTHSPLLTAYPKSEILQLSESGKIEKVGYTETEHYIVTKQFLNDPERMLKYLLEDDE